MVEQYQSQSESLGADPPSQDRGDQTTDWAPHKANATFRCPTASMPVVWDYIPVQVGKILDVQIDFCTCSSQHGRPSGHTPVYDAVAACAHRTAVRGSVEKQQLEHPDMPVPGRLAMPIVREPHAR
eukprot:365313-Chlamydomonas_euryale.AAC.19